MEVAGFVGVVVVGGVLIWLALRLEPHWVSRDGQRFICRGQLLDGHGNTLGRWQEYRFRVTPEGHLVPTRRSLVKVGGHGGALWSVGARADDPPRRKAVFLLHDASDPRHMMAIRMPATSRAVDTLDGLLPLP